jgi:hypothetical protein
MEPGWAVWVLWIFVGWRLIEIGGRMALFVFTDKREIELTASSFVIYLVWTVLLVITFVEVLR